MSLQRSSPNPAQMMWSSRCCACVRSRDGGTRAQRRSSVDRALLSAHRGSARSARVVIFEKLFLVYVVSCNFALWRRKKRSTVFSRMAMCVSLSACVSARLALCLSPAPSLPGHRATLTDAVQPLPFSFSPRYQRSSHDATRIPPYKFPVGVLIWYPLPLLKGR